MVHLRFRLVTLFLQPFHQRQRLELVSAFDDSHACLQSFRRESLLQKGNDVRDHYWYTLCFSSCQANQGFESFTDDIDVRQLRFVRQNFPRGIEERVRRALCPGRKCHPGLRILVKRFLRFHTFDNGDNCPSWQ
jgi:hypothetical protein